VGGCLGRQDEMPGWKVLCFGWDPFWVASGRPNQVGLLLLAQP